MRVATEITAQLERFGVRPSRGRSDIVGVVKEKCEPELCSWVLKARGDLCRKWVLFVWRSGWLVFSASLSHWVSLVRGAEGKLFGTECIL